MLTINCLTALNDGDDRVGVADVAVGSEDKTVARKPLAGAEARHAAALRDQSDGRRAASFMVKDFLTVVQ